MLRAACSRCLRQGVRQSAVWQARGFAEAPAAKAAGGDLATTEDINWDLFDTLITSDEGQRELAGLRSAIATYQQKVDDMAKPAQVINWEQYKDTIDKDLLAAMKEAYTGMQLPEFDVEGTLKEVDEKFKPLLEQAEEMAAFSKKRAAEIEEEIKQIDAEMARLSKVTVDEELAAHPEIAAAVDKEIADGRFY